MRYRLLLSPYDGWNGFGGGDVITVTRADRPLGSREHSFGQALIDSDEPLEVLRVRYEHPLDACRICGLFPPRWSTLHKHSVDDLRLVDVSETQGEFEQEEPFITSRGKASGKILEVSETTLTLQLDSRLVAPDPDELIIGDTTSAYAFVDRVNSFDGAVVRIAERQWRWDSDDERLVDKRVERRLSWMSDEAKRRYHPFTLFKVATGKDHPHLGREPEFDPPEQS